MRLSSTPSARNRAHRIGAAMRQRRVVWIATGEIGLADEADFVFRDR